MSKKIEDVLNQISEDVLTEDSKKMLSEAFAEAVEATVTERLDLEVSNALQQLDEEHSAKLEQLLEAIDTDHSQKLVAVLEKIDKDHTEKLEFLIKKHQKALNEDAKEFKENLLSQLSNYMELYLDKAIPKEELQEAVSNKRAQKILEQMKQMIALDDSFINETIKEAVQDGRKTIDSLKSELNEAIKQNIQVTQALKAKAAELILEKNTAGLPKEKKQYVMRMLKDKDPEYITENFNYVVKMFDKEEEDHKVLVTEQATKSSKIVTEKVDTPRNNKETEKASFAPEGDGVSEYLSAMKQQDRFKTK
jgi:inorganic pyrophosphatase